MKAFSVLCLTTLLVLGAALAAPRYRRVPRLYEPTFAPADAEHHHYGASFSAVLQGPVEIAPNLTQTVLAPWQYGPVGYASYYFDTDTGVYTAPVRSAYSIRTTVEYNFTTEHPYLPHFLVYVNDDRIDDYYHGTYPNGAAYTLSAGRDVLLQYGDRVTLQVQNHDLVDPITVSRATFSINLL